MSVDQILICACGCGRSRQRHAVEIRNGTGLYYDRTCSARHRAKLAAAAGKSSTAAATAAAARARRWPQPKKREAPNPDGLPACSCGRAAGISRLQDRAGKYWAVGCDLPDCTGYRAATGKDLAATLKDWRQRHTPTKTAVNGGD